MPNESTMPSHRKEVGAEIPHTSCLPQFIRSPSTCSQFVQADNDLSWKMDTQQSADQNHRRNVGQRRVRSSNSMVGGTEKRYEQEDDEFQQVPRRFRERH
ncbi:hypothetical protein CLAIMM_06178 isoform 2 [Cladophialophora immunda]|nr:hypothetical protein CLAIMM_06178 isoform 2 [Cladophialophora immunda]